MHGYSRSPFGAPRPCPVDDAPHTTCTSPDAGEPIVIVQLPMRDAAPRPAMSVPPVVLQPGEFTQKTYRRAVHGGPGRKR